MTGIPARVTQGFPALRFVGSPGWKALLLPVSRVTFLLCKSRDISNLLQQWSEMERIRGNANFDPVTVIGV